MTTRMTLLLLASPIVAALCVPFYNRVTPTLDGWPFFYWWQTGCVLAGALLTGAACLLDARTLRAAEMRPQEGDA
ncbi:DUF3311 domain-containing protein [Paraburkholderia guartelaensis]|uniref:DUF3311 domain-containing protein n=1 Tax=Paraburkholderia guartelaensis TaxID=2546446 RepID=UPI002AB793C7|nr:DUF3311 domain-containing protein [Paraburkholderia guartelaensis]